MKTVSINKITVYNIVSTVLLQGIAFISGPIFSGTLGTSNYGIAAVYLTWVQITSIVFSLQAAGTVAVARVHFPLNRQLEYQSSVLSLATLFYILFSTITIICSIIFQTSFNLNLSMICVGLAHGWGLYVLSFINSKFTYEFKADKNFILSICVSVLTIVLSLCLISIFLEENNYWGRILGQSIVYFIAGIVLYAYIIHYGKQIMNKEYWKFTFPIAFPIVFHSLATIILNQSDKIMLQNMISSSAAGIYALSNTFGTVLSTVWNALNNSWVPFYYDYTKKNQIEKIKKHAKNYVELFTIVAMVFMLLAPEVFHLYANKNFWGGTDFIPLFSIGYYFIFLYSFPVNYEFYNKKTRTIAIGTSGAAICNIILNYFFIKLCGIQGAVIATAVSHGLQFGFHYISAQRINPEEFPFKILNFIPGFSSIFNLYFLFGHERLLADKMGVGSHLRLLFTS